MTLTLDRVILHTVMYHSSTSTYIPNFIEIKETFCGRTDVHLRPALLGRLLNIHSTHRDNLQHLLSRDVAIAVKIIHAERPFQLLFQSTSRGHAQRTDKLAEINRSIAVCIERSENMLRKPRCVTIRKEVAVNLLKFLHCQESRWAVLPNTCYRYNF